MNNLQRTGPVVTFIAIILCTAAANAQQFMWGINVGAGWSYPIAQNESSPYSFSGKQGLGIGIPVMYRFNKSFSVLSGINFQNKSYKLSHEKFEFPQLQYSGMIQLIPKYNVIQLPLLGSYRLLDLAKGGLDIKLGIMYSIYKHVQLKAETDWKAKYSGNDTFEWEFRAPSKWLSTSGLEVMAGVGYIIKGANQRRHEINLSVEYAFFGAPEIEYVLLLRNSTDQKQYAVKESPRLLFTKLSYTFYFNRDKSINKE